VEREKRRFHWLRDGEPAFRAKREEPRQRDVNGTMPADGRFYPGCEPGARGRQQDERIGDRGAQTADFGEHGRLRMGEAEDRRRLCRASGANAVAVRRAGNLACRRGVEAQRVAQRIADASQVQFVDHHVGGRERQRRAVFMVASARRDDAAVV
jgi:hypothetical protein